jgi:hypothetical protein
VSKATSSLCLDTPTFEKTRFSTFRWPWLHGVSEEIKIRIYGRLIHDHPI